MNLKLRYIPRILRSIVLFGFGSSLLIDSLAGWKPAGVPQVYVLLEIMIALLLLGAGIFVLVFPRGKPPSI